MKFDMTVFDGMVIPIVTAACLILGFIVKKWIKDVENKWIPTILAVFGAALACVTGKAISVELIVSGAFSGLASTGLHQVFKQLVTGGDKSENGKDL